MSRSDDFCMRCRSREGLHWEGVKGDFLCVECRRLEPLLDRLARIDRHLSRLVELVDGIDGRLQL